ncbi:hypothetical protein B0T26DRAFT_670173 [Lasiosphaeria miniovina]|uniref:Uncharacterized protein n=1 Tax=Lasiosphaeria miniovina TaxID=1954250 RepID=A0AA40ED05_9PEZI|nr:uncharacterized protein B0T26DRAFT_670173 [Lasiosphaeria miniovina]KAK0733807.1 hypothetical protein B0T26DRAFT_670173 [Lasiosphaeria miniovina]
MAYMPNGVHGHMLAMKPGGVTSFRPDERIPCSCCASCLLFLNPKYGMHPGLKKFQDAEFTEFLRGDKELRDWPDLEVAEEKRAEAAEKERRRHETLEKSRGTGIWRRDDDVSSINSREYDNPVVRRQERKEATRLFSYEGPYYGGEVLMAL